MKFDCPLKERFVSCQTCRTAEEEAFQCFYRTALTAAGELLKLVEQKTIEQYENEKIQP